MKETALTTKNALIAQLVKKNVQPAEAAIPCMTVCVHVCYTTCIVDK